MALAERIQETLLRARLVERLIHDVGPWSIVWQGQNVEVVRLVTDTMLSLSGEVVIDRDAPAGVSPAWLYCDEDVVFSAPIEHPALLTGDTYLLTWIFSMGAALVA